MFKYYKYANCGIISLASLALATFLAINPNGFADVALTIFATALALGGVVACILSLKSKDESKKLLAFGLAQVLLGNILIFVKSYLVSNISVLPLYLGGAMLLVSAFYIYALVKNITQKGRIFTPAVCVFLTVATSLVILFYPFADWILWRFLALSIALQGVLYFYITFGSRAFDEETEEVTEEVTEEASQETPEE